MFKHYRLWGEPVNLRDQHDALEFFNSLVDSLDEALKALGQQTILSKVLGGSFADQKICKDCPHRYQREESFTALNIDIRNHHNLLESLEQYVKGDLLEGANAYHCEKCNKKVSRLLYLYVLCYEVPFINSTIYLMAGMNSISLKKINNSNLKEEKKQAKKYYDRESIEI